MTLQLAYDPQLSRVRVTAGGLSTAAASARLERSDAAGIRWETVRGGEELQVQDDGTGTAYELRTPADDYEFHADELNRYRLTTYDAGGVQLDQLTATTTPQIGAYPWLKVPARPYLNRAVTVLDWDDVERPARSGVFDVLSRTFPVAVSDVAGSRRFGLQLVTETETEARELELALAAGDVLYLQVPAGSDCPGGYLAAGDVKISRPSRKSRRRIFAFAVTEVAAPAADIVGSSSTWNSVLAGFATWGDVMAGNASWNELLEMIGNPEDVIVQ